MLKVVFVRNDGQLNEEYIYRKYEDAQYHESLFDDDSGL